MSDTPQPPPRPVEQLPIPLFNGVVLAVRVSDGTIWLGLRDLCVTLGLALETQRRRIRANESLHMIQLRIYDGQQFRARDFLMLDDVSLWILSIQSERVSEDVRQRFSYIKDYLVDAVKTAFARLTGLPETSRQIEDVRELDRIDLAVRTMEELSARQSTLEASQDRARTVFRDMNAFVRDLQARVQALEAQLKFQLSPMQRGTLYHLVQTWGVALAEHRSTKPGEGIRMCWRLFNQRFDIATYTDLPAAHYDEALQFIKEQYRGLTGRELDAAEQTGMEFEP